MTKTKFDPKVYTEPRVYPEVPGSGGIRRLFTWDESLGEYRPPAVGKCYLARRWEDDNGKKKRVTRYFETLTEARQWRDRRSSETEQPKRKAKTNLGPLFQDVVEMWKRHKFRGLSEGTRVTYGSRLPHLEPLMTYPIRAITKDTIDDWIENLSPRSGKGKKGRPRQNFTEIVSLLRTILLHYQEEGEDQDFRMPLRERHFDMAAVPLRRVEDIPKDIKPDELKKFIAALEVGRGYGHLMAVFATVQFYQARRISEVVDLRWEDCTIDLRSPEKSRIRFVRHMIWNVEKGNTFHPDPGLKNSDTGIEHPMAPETYWALMRLYKVGAKGRIFPRPKDGEPFTYMQVYRKYNQAYERAGLPYRATHPMRHGGSSMTYNETGGDLEVVKQHLGNSSLVSILTYAKRDPRAFSQHTSRRWSHCDHSERVVEQVNK